MPDFARGSTRRRKSFNSEMFFTYAIYYCLPCGTINLQKSGPSALCLRLLRSHDALKLPAMNRRSSSHSLARTTSVLQLSLSRINAIQSRSPGNFQILLHPLGSVNSCVKWPRNICSYLVTTAQNGAEICQLGPKSVI